jgi:hypothetical protein
MTTFTRLVEARRLAVASGEAGIARDGGLVTVRGRCVGRPVEPGYKPSQPRDGARVKY